MLCDQNSIPNLRDRLTGALVGLARATDGNEHLIRPSATATVLECLAATCPEAEVSSETLLGLLDRVAEEKRQMVPDCFLCANPCGRTDDYDMQQLLDAPDSIFRRKLRLLSGIRTLAARLLGSGLTQPEPELETLFYHALILVGMDRLRGDIPDTIQAELDRRLRSPV